MKTKKPISDINVAEVMTDHVDTLTPIDTIKYAVNLMLDSKLTTAPVVDGQNKCVGILSRSDLTEMFLQEDSELSHVLDTDRLSREWLNRSLDTGDAVQVKELMTIDVATIRSSETLADACRKMAQHKVHHLPVVDDDNVVVGILSAFDVVLTVAEN